MVGGSWASDWRSYGDVTPAARCFLQPCSPVELDSAVSLTLTVPALLPLAGKPHLAEEEYEKRVRKAPVQPDFLLTESISANCQVPLSIPWRTPPQPVADNLDDNT